MTRLIAILVLSAVLLPAEDWHTLFNGKNLDGWEIRGDSTWTVLKDGTLLGQRPHDNPFTEWPITREQFNAWTGPQSWHYTAADFDQFDLHAEYLNPPRGNSGISIRDTSRAKYALPGPDHDSNRTPAHIGYEIQVLANSGTEKYPTGSVYLFGQLVAESPGDPARSKTGAIGLQLHDRFTWIMFRSIKTKEIG